MNALSQLLFAPSRRVRKDQRDSATQLQILLLGLLLAALVGYGVLVLAGRGTVHLLPLLISAGVLLALYALARLGLVRVASVLLLALAEGVIGWHQLAVGVESRLSYLVLIFVAMAWLLLGTSGGLGYAALVGLATLLIGGRQLARAPGALPVVDLAIFMLTLAGLSIVLWLFTHRLQRIYGRLLQQDQRTREYAIAQQIQQRLLPDTVPQPEVGRLRAWCQPAQEISGDFYDVIKLSKGRLGIVVGDVCGKGLPAALLMNMARTTLRAEALHSASAAVTLSKVSAVLAQDLARTQFIALSYAVLEARTGKLRLANAGQLEPILVRGGRVQYLSGPGERLPLGLGVERRYDELTVQLQPGDRVLFYTDGALEAQNGGGELFGFERFQSLLQRVKPGISVIERVQRDLDRFTGGQRPHDDVTLVELDLSGRV